MSDSVTVDGTVFHRLGDGVYADIPYAIRVQVGVPLTSDQANTLAALVGYAYAKTGGERGNGFTQDTPNSIVYGCDTTKGRAYRRLDTFFEDVAAMIVEGSPPRKTKNNTRLVEGLGDVGEITFYADSVYPTPEPEPEKPKLGSGDELAPGIYTAQGQHYRVGKNGRMAQFRAGKWRAITRSDEHSDATYRVQHGGQRTPLDVAVSVGRASGVCLACGRALKDPASVARGVGSECLKKF